MADETSAEALFGENTNDTDKTTPNNEPSNAPSHSSYPITKPQQEEQLFNQPDSDKNIIFLGTLTFEYFRTNINKTKLRQRTWQRKHPKSNRPTSKYPKSRVLLLSNLLKEPPLKNTLVSKYNRFVIVCLLIC